MLPDTPVQKEYNCSISTTAATESRMQHQFQTGETTQPVFCTNPPVMGVPAENGEAVRIAHPKWPADRIRG